MSELVNFLSDYGMAGFGILCLAGILLGFVLVARYLGRKLFADDKGYVPRMVDGHLESMKSVSDGVKTLANAYEHQTTILAAQTEQLGEHGRKLDTHGKHIAQILEIVSKDSEACIQTRD